MAATGTNVISIAQYSNRKNGDAVSTTTAFTPAFYEAEGPENVPFLPGSDRKPAHLSHSWDNPAPHVSLVPSTPLGDAALERIYRVLRDRRTAKASRSVADVVQAWRLQGR